MSTDLTYADATTLATLIRTGQTSSAAIVQHFLTRIQHLNPTLNAIVTINPHALALATAADAAVRSGSTTLGPLHGVPFTVKDSIDTADLPTQRGSPVFAGRVPSTDASAVARLKAAGAILLAKTNLPEFSYGTESANLLSGRTNNPWNLDRTPGGSSGGESAAIAAGLSPLGLGTDLAISVRGPAAQTGIVALKGTHGRVPMTGIWPRAPRRFWHVGPMARSVRDLRLAYSILAGPDGRDGLASQYGAFDAASLAAPQKRLKVGWLVSPGFGPINPEVRATVTAAAEALKTSGITVEPVRIPAIEKDSPLDVFLDLRINEMKPGFEETLRGQPDEHIGAIGRRWLEIEKTPNEAFVNAVQAAERLKDGFAEYFAEYDALLCPTLPMPAHVHDLKSVDVEGEAVDGLKVMKATVPFNVTGLPALSLPFGHSQERLPIGVQLVGSWLAESTILHLALLLESQSPVKDQHPDI